jgi:hypothetical protein
LTSSLLRKPVSVAGGQAAAPPLPGRCPPPPSEPSSPAPSSRRSSPSASYRSWLSPLWNRLHKKDSKKGKSHEVFYEDFFWHVSTHKPGPKMLCFIDVGETSLRPGSDPHDFKADPHSHCTYRGKNIFQKLGIKVSVKQGSLLSI